MIVLATGAIQADTNGLLTQHRTLPAVVPTYQKRCAHWCSSDNTVDGGGAPTAPLIRTESCSTGGKLCLVLEAWLEPLVMEMTVPRHEPIGVVFLNVADAVSCLLSVYI